MRSYWFRRIVYSKFFSTLIVALVLLTLSVIPPLHSLGRLNIGYDTFIPLYPEHSLNMIGQWTDRYNGIYTLNLYSVWVSIFIVLKNIGLSIYEAAFVYQVLIFFLSGIGVYRIFNLYNKSGKLFGLIPAAFFIYSPYLLDHMLYQLGTIGIVWCIYVFLKFVVKKKLDFWDPLILCGALSTIIDLPNPKYHFLLVICSLSILILSLILRLINIQTLRNNLGKFSWTLLLSSYLSIPFLYFAYSFLQFNPYQINIKKDYAASGESLDYGVALINKMIRLFHTPNLISSSVDLINTTIPFFIYYILPVLIFGLFPFVIYKNKGEQKKQYFLIYLMALALILLSKGSNAPYGLVYELLLLVPQLVFMRTTAGIVIYAAIFYALIFGLIFEYFYHKGRSKLMTVLFFSALIIAYGFPYWSGLYYLNRFNVSPKQGTYGITIPNDYFKAADALKNRDDDDSKIQIVPFSEGYQTNSWGYFGFIFYPWLFKQPIVSSNQDTVEGLLQVNTNTRYIVYDKSIVKQKTFPEIVLPEDLKLIFTSKNIDIYEKKKNTSVPHVYITSKNIITDAIPKSWLDQTGLKDKKIGIYSFKNSPELLVKIPNTLTLVPKVQYRKINPARYEVTIENAHQTFPLILNETYHPGWKVYLKKMSANRLFSPFEVFTSRQIRERHLLVNKSFNAWLLSTSEICYINNCVKNSDGTYDIKLILDFYPQSLANLGIGISSVSLAIYLLLGALSFRKREKK